MKKTTIFSSALVALAMLASCQKEQPIETPATTTGVTEFTATIETPTKTVIDTDGKVTWEIDDEITVTDAESKSAVYVATSSGASTTFTLIEGLTAVGAGPYTATYGDINKQKYKANAAGANCPLSAETKDASSKTLHFSSPYAVVKLTAKSSGGESVKTVVVTYGNSSSILDCGDGVALTSTGVDFYVAVRPSTEAAALSVSFYTADKMAKKTRTSNVSLAAKDLLPVTFESLTWDAQKTFKAVYDTNGDANTLTFYYDNDDHSRDGITVYQDGTAKWLFDDSKDNWLKWGYDDKRESINSVVIDESVADYPFLTSTAFMFYNMKNADSILGAEHLDVSNVTNMANMFNSYGKESTSLTAPPDVSEWNTGNVTNMANMFNSYGKESTSLTAPPDVSEWNTGNVTDMGYMFSGYGQKSTSLTDVPDVTGWKTDKVEKMGNLFANYGNANNIDCKFDLTGWNLAKLTTGNIFNNFNPNTFVVKIPAKTGENANQPGDWYGSGYRFGPPTYKYFIPVLTGVFTVSDEKKVHFSNSNLVAAIDDYGAPTAWKFAANQYGYLGKGGANQTIGNTSTKGAAGDVDLFGWSTDAALNNWGIHTKTSSDDDIASYTSGTFNDWGSQMGDGNTWRTLSKDEWQYLFNTRTVNGGTGEGNSYQGAYINSTGEANSGVYGVILYPDNYTSQTGAASYTSAEWATMEAAGCVFLPAAKGREGSSVNISGGQYWSSSEYGSSGGGAYYVCFGSGDVKPGNSGDRCHGLSVRLITECQ